MYLKFYYLIFILQCYFTSKKDYTNLLNSHSEGLKTSKGGFSNLIDRVYYLEIDIDIFILV